MPPAELVSLLLGTPPLLERPTQVALDVDDKAGVYVLTLADSDTREEIALHPATLRPVGVAFAERGMLSAYRADFDGYEGDADLPRIVRLSSGATKVELTWKDRDTKPEYEASIFTLTPPEGVEHVRVH